MASKARGLMWITILSLALLAVSVALVFVLRRDRVQIDALIKSREKIQVEEDRVFEFLRGLGDAFSGDVQLSDLHRLIVEGATGILRAHGGGLYLRSRDGKALLPAFVSKSCPPLVAVPAHVLQQAETAPQALVSYLRLHAVQPGEGVLGQVWNEREPILLTGDDGRLEELRDTVRHTSSAMIAPLVYAKQFLGVMAVANGSMGGAFTMSEFAIFKAIAGQSAFALYNAIVYSQAAEKKRLDADLQTAQDIQRILLPAKNPDIPGYEISGINIPAQHVSGDYFDYLEVDANRLGVAIADVSGKGVPASLIMAMCRSVLRSKMRGQKSPAAVLDEVNRELYPDIKEDMFISMAYVILDGRTDRFTLCRAGHDAPLIYRAATERLEQFNPPGMALGIDSGDVFGRITADFSQSLGEGDCMVLYTDGVTEALDSRGREFGLNRMKQSIQTSARSGALGVINRLRDDLREFTGSQPQNDDITLIVIRRT